MAASAVAELTQEQELVRAWSRDFPKYVHDTFDVTPTSQQLEVMTAICEMVWAKLRCFYWNQRDKRLGEPSERDKKLNSQFGISIMAGVGTGKGALGSWFIHWFQTCFTQPKILVTSISKKQMDVTLWSELALWHKKSKIKDWFVWQSDKFFLKEEGGSNWFAQVRTANPRNSAEEQAETLAGAHANFLAIIADEASGIPDPVFRPLETTLTGRCNFCLLFFNPTRSKGFAYDTHFKDRKAWSQYRWNAEESDIVTRDSIERLKKKYGRDSNTYRIRVLGLPPVSGENLVIPWDLIESATDLELEPLGNDPLIGSLDVGAGGDDSVYLTRRGPVVHPLEIKSTDDSNILTDWACDFILDAEPTRAYVDTIGVGWAIGGNLRKRIDQKTTEVIDVNVAQTAYNPTRFYRLRDELWWRLREAFEKGQLSIPNDPLLMGDLNSPRYEEVAGKIKVETKKDMKARGVDSPNRADALMMTMMQDMETVRKLEEHRKRQKRKDEKHRSWRTV